MTATIWLITTESVFWFSSIFCRLKSSLLHLQLPKGEHAHIHVPTVRASVCLFGMRGSSKWWRSQKNRGGGRDAGTHEQPRVPVTPVPAWELVCVVAWVGGSATMKQPPVGLATPQCWAKEDQRKERKRSEPITADHRLNLITMLTQLKRRQLQHTVSEAQST